MIEFESKEELSEFLYLELLTGILPINGKYIISDGLQEYIKKWNPRINQKSVIALALIDKIKAKIVDGLVDIFYDDPYTQDGKRRSRVTIRRPNGEPVTLSIFTNKATQILSKFIKEYPAELDNLVFGTLGYYIETNRWSKIISNYFEEGIYLNYAQYLSVEDESNSRYK